MNSPVITGFFPPLAFALALTACGTGKLDRDLVELRTSINADTHRYATEDQNERSISWNDASQRMVAEDLSLRQAEIRVADTRATRERQWREWLPRPTIYANLQNSLKNIGSVSRDDISLTFLAPLSIPNPRTQYARAYQYALQELQAQAGYQLALRRQTAGLYRLFSQWERREKRFEVNRRLTSGENAALEGLIEGQLREREHLLQDQESRQTLQTQLSRLLNFPGVAVVPRSGTRPSLDYSARIDSLKPGVNYGGLATELAAYELEAAILRAKGIQFARWPSASLAAGIPALYDSNRPGDGFIGNSDQFILFGNVGKSFDITGREAENLRNAEQHVEYVRTNLQLRLSSEAQDWLRLKRRYLQLVERRALVRARLDSALRRPVGSAADSLETARRLGDELDQIDQAKEDLDLQLWVWDDAAWKSKSAPASVR